MANSSRKLQEGIGRLFDNDERQQSQSLPQTAEITEIKTIHQRGLQPVTVADMTREELRARRIRRIEKASNIVEGKHIKVMLFAMDATCLVGPFYIAFMTTSELGQLFTNGKPFTWSDQTSLNMYGAALFGEIILMCLTFFSQYIRSYVHSLDPRSEEYQKTSKVANGAMYTWYVFAAIGALGQAYYLYHYWQPQANLFTWLLIIGRVCIYTGGDYVCAKYLAWRMPTLKKLMIEEREKSQMYDDMEKQEADSLKREKEAEAHIRSIEIEVESKDRRAEMIGNVEKTVSEATTTAVSRVAQIMDSALSKAMNVVNKQLEGPKDNNDITY
jgi:hypothetical protein